MRVPKLPGSPDTSRLVVRLFSLLYGIGFLIVFYVQSKDRRRINLQRQTGKVINTRTQEPRSPSKLNIFWQLQNQVHHNLQFTISVIMPIQLTTLGQERKLL